MLRHLISMLLVLGVVLAQQNLTGENLDSFIEGIFAKPSTVTNGSPPINPPTTPIVNPPPEPNKNLTGAGLDSFIEGIFTKPSTVINESPPINPPITPMVNPPQIKPPVNPPTVNPEPLPPGVPTENDCPGGECVAHFHCENNTFVTDGNGLIDIRFDKDNPQRCVDYLETCCGMEDIIIKPATPAPIPQTKPAECGYRNNNGIGFKITPADGQSEYAEFPWMVAILREERSGDKVLKIYQCGGSLIHAKVVLTAAHCTNNRAADTLQIRAGEWDTQTRNEIFPQQDRDVVEIIEHSQYYKGGLFNDISLLILNEPVEYELNVQTICLPPQNAVFDNSRCTATGWGKDVFGREGKYQVILKKIELPIVPRATCQDSLRRTRLGRRFKLHESFICAGGEPGKDTCKGDGGSPLVCPIDNTPDRYYQSGIVAWGIGCGENQVPGVYAGVAQFRNWIDQQFSQRGLDSSSYIAT